MRVDVEHRPSFGLAVVTLDPGETVIAESGSMVAMTAGLGVSTHLNGAGGGVFGLLYALCVAIVRRVLGGETLFVNHFTASEAGQRVWLAPAMVGDVHHIAMDGNRKITVQSSSYLASSPGVEVALVWGGFSMLFSGEGAFFLECSGQGDLLLTSYGAIEELAIDGEYVVDSGHVVAFEGELEWTLSRAGGSWKSTLLSGEGFVQTFKGRGVVWLQTRQIGSLVSWIRPLLP